MPDTIPPEPTDSAKLARHLKKATARIAELEKAISQRDEAMARHRLTDALRAEGVPDEHLEAAAKLAFATATEVVFDAGGEIRYTAEDGSEHLTHESVALDYVTRYPWTLRPTPPGESSKARTLEGMSQRDLMMAARGGPQAQKPAAKEVQREINRLGQGRTLDELRPDELMLLARKVK